MPEIVDLRELYGLILYRLGMWEEAIDDLEYFRTHSGTAEQHPVLMDTHRALEHWADVDELWNELREASPSSALVSNFWTYIINNTCGLSINKICSHE